MEQGYEVFTNVSEYGPIDFIARKGKKMIMVDVKTKSSKQNSYKVTATRLQKELGVKFLVWHKNEFKWGAVYGI